MYADYANAACDIFSILLHGVAVEANFALGRDVVGWRYSTTAGEIIHKNVLVRQFAWATNWLLPSNDPVLDTTNTDNDLEMKREAELVLATGPNSQFGSRSGSNPEQDRCNGFYHTKTRTGITTKTHYFTLTTFAPIKYLSSDRIMTWSVHRLSIISHSFTSRVHNCNVTNICWVAIESPQISHQIWRYFTATQQILVAMPFWLRKVKELLKLHNLCTDHVTIRSEPKN